MRKPLIAANWKMFKTVAEARSTAQAMRNKLEPIIDREIVICPPATALFAVADALKGSPLACGGQNVHWEAQGAFTGEISAAMLADLGCRYAIVGHSERRQYFGESDETVNKRMHAALKGALIPIVCIGETLQEREANRTFDVLDRQIAQGMKALSASSTIVIAYEPVWAIGTGKTATPVQAQEAHSYIRKQFAKLYGDSIAHTTRILYGGSVKPDNMSALMSQPDIDGGLVGGASLEVESFTKIAAYTLTNVASV
jgi:triosephosphate isomerase (TIM)